MIAIRHWRPFAALAGAAMLLLAVPGSAQTAGPVDTAEPGEYGNAIIQIFPSYTGEEILTADGRTIAYRQTDQYDEYEMAEGANAVFVDMQTGKTRLVVPKGSDKGLFFLSTIYDKSNPDIGIGYVARMGSREDNDNGRLDMIIGRFSDLEQKQVFENVRFVDGPTHVSGTRVSLILWPEDLAARFVEIDLATFEITKNDAIDLPEPVPDAPRSCMCEVTNIGEPLGEADATDFSAEDSM